MSSPQPKSGAAPVRERPLSPHLQIYRLPLAALQSISHRITGVVLSGGIVVLVAVLFSAAASPDYFNWWHGVLNSNLGILARMALAFCLFYHLCAGVRHLVWDAGFGFEKKDTAISNIIVILSAAVLTGIAWVAALQKLHIIA